MIQAADFLRWGFPIGLLILAIILRPVLTSILSRLVKTLRTTSFSMALEEIAPLLAWLIYPFCIRWAVTVAPISLVAASTVRDSCYVIEICIVMTSARTLALSSMEWGSKRLSGTPVFSAGFFPIIRNLITLITLLFGAILILQHFGYDVWSLITALGVGSLAVGLAAKDTLSHMISGFILIMDRNLRPGDRISFSGAVGTVEEIGLRSTRILTGQGSAWIVPNSELVNTKILNYSMSSGIRISASIRVTLDTSLDQVRALAHDVLPTIKGAKGSRAVEVQVLGIIEGTQQVELGFWIVDPSPELQGRALSDFLERFLQEAGPRQIRIAGAPAAPAPTV